VTDQALDGFAVSGEALRAAADAPRAEDYAAIVAELRPDLRFEFVSPESVGTASGDGVTVHRVASGDLAAMLECVPPRSLVPVGRVDQHVADAFAASRAGREILFVGKQEVRDVYRWEEGLWRPRPFVVAQHAFATALSGMEAAAHYLSDEPVPGAKKMEDTERQRGFSIVRYYRGAGQMNSAIGLAKRHRYATPDDLDDHPGMLNTPRGLVVVGTDEVLPHNPRRLISKRTDGDWDPEIHLPLLDDLYEAALPEPDERRLFFQLMGASLLGDDRQPKAIVILWSDIPHTGKSLIPKLFGAALGEGSFGYAKVGADLEGIRETRHARTHNATLADARGIRLLTFTEANKDLDIPGVKRLSGKDVIEARGPYGYPVRYVPQFIAWFSANKMPRFPSDDPAMWARLYVFELTRKGLPREEFLTLLTEPLARTAQLAIAARGARDFLENGLVVPASVRERTQQKREESAGIIQEWLDARCEIDPNAVTPTSKLLLSFREFMEGLEASERPSSTTFGNWLRDHGFESPKDPVRVDGEGKVRVRKGLRLRAAAV
jgi:phage/plasmid-associated DNA primase